MSRQIMITDPDTTVSLQLGADSEPDRLSFGDDPDGVTLVGDLYLLQQKIIEADRQIAQALQPAVRSNGSPS